MDLFVVLPFSKILKSWLSPDADRLLYFIKVLRLYKAFWLLDHKTFSKQLKLFQAKRIK